MKAIFAILGSTMMLFANTCLSSGFIGSIVPPLPEGWKSYGGVCITDPLGQSNNCDYMFGNAKTPNGLILYFGKSVPRINPNISRWLITDKMSYPKTTTGQHLVYNVCERNSKSDSTIVALVKPSNTEWYSKVFFAYKANLKIGRIEKISIKGVRCFNEGWGI